MGAAAIAVGAGLAASGQASQAIGEEQANHAQQSAVHDAQAQQQAIDAQNADAFNKLLGTQDPNNLLTQTAAVTNREADPLTDIARTVAAAHNTVAGSGASSNTKGAITAATQGAGERGAYLGRLQARLRAQQLLNLQRQNAEEDYMAQKLRLQTKSQGVERLLPITLAAAKLKGAQYRAAGQTGSMLGQLLLQYGLSQPNSSGAKATDQSSLAGGPYTAAQAEAEAPTTGWAAEQPGMT